MSLELKVEYEFNCFFCSGFCCVGFFFPFFFLLFLQAGVSNIHFSFESVLLKEASSVILVIL